MSSTHWVLLTLFSVLNKVTSRTQSSEKRTYKKTTCINTKSQFTSLIFVLILIHGCIYVHLRILILNKYRLRKSADRVDLIPHLRKSARSTAPGHYKVITSVTFKGFKAFSIKVQTLNLELHAHLISLIAKQIWYLLWISYFLIIYCD